MISDRTIKVKSRGVGEGFRIEYKPEDKNQMIRLKA